MPKKTKDQPLRRVIGYQDDDPIVGSSLKLVGQGTGLSDALTVDGRRFHREEMVSVLVRGSIKEVGYGDAGTNVPEECIEIGRLRITDGIIVDPELADSMIRAEAERIAQAKSEMDGAQASLLDALDAALDLDELGVLRGQMLAAGIPELEADRHAYLRRVLDVDEIPDRLRQSHARMIRADLEIDELASEGGDVDGDEEFERRP